MTYRVTPSNVLDVVRALVDELDMLKRQTGTVKQNTIRLGDWVLEAVDDSLVKMTNLVTGAVSYIGAPSDVDVTAEGGDGAYIEVPPFSFGGIVRNAFSSVNMRTNVYEMPVDFAATSITATLVNLSLPGPTFVLYQNASPVFTSTALPSHKTTFPVNLTLAAGDELYVEVTNDGNGFSAGLAVMLRGVPTIIEQ